ncbi:uncharacterized protein LOC143226115 isoform X4 [Tachypleus tridentatus]|uniref:uncharacterized protein LOC143226115 isoform X4 n=1 Tax=Tachypleus tridentatus TaxID=6853 RepID=UPI003FCF3E77
MDPDRRRRWIAAVNRKNWTPTEHTRLCSKHFVSDLFMTWYWATYFHDYGQENILLLFPTLLLDVTQENHTNEV